MTPVPAVIGEEPVYAWCACRFRVVPHFLHDAPSAPVIFKIQPLLRSSGSPGNHAHKAGFGIVLPIPYYVKASTSAGERIDHEERQRPSFQLANNR